MALSGFLGQYDITIDDKGRVRIPAKYRSQLGDEFIIACGENACLSIYPVETWEKFKQQISSLSDLDERTIEFKRRLYTNATWGEFDSAGRVLIPVRFREYAQLKKELVASGVDDHFELWDAENWAAGEYSSLERRRDLQKEISQKLSGGNHGI